MRYFLPLFVLVLAGCASAPDDREMTEARHYGEARELLDKKSYLAAIESLEEVEARFPYGRYTQQVQLDLIYTYFKALDYPQAVAEADSFVRNNPDHPALDYALYMKGLANFYLDIGLFDRLVEQKKGARDLTSMREAFDDFSELVRRFPHSEFAPDARQRMLYIRNQLARGELHAARYYARRGAFIAAANRAQFVIRHFQGSPAVPEALAILSKSYEELDQPGLAAKSARVLRHNWPEAGWLGEDDEIVISWWPDGDRDWFHMVTFDLFH